MNPIKYITLIVAGLFCSLFLYGQGMTLEACRRMALENNKQIAIAERTKEKAHLTVQATKTNFLPKLSAQGLGYYNNSSRDLNLKMGQMTLFDPNDLSGMVPAELMPLLSQFSVLDIPDMNFNLKTSNTYVAGVNLEQPIYMGGKITSAYKMSKVGDEIAGLNRELTEYEIILATDKAYWACVQARELEKSAAQFKTTVEEFHRVVQNACEAGMKSKNDVMKVQVQLNQAELQLRRAENGVRLSRMNLCHLLGLPLQSEIMPTENFSEQSFELSGMADITARPDWAILDKQIELKKYEKQYVRSDFLPQVGVRGSYNYIHGIRLNNDPLFDGGSFSAMVSVRIPLFNWGEGVKKVKAAERERQIMQLQRDDLGEKMSLEVEQALNLYNEALLEIRLTRQALEQTEENLRMSQDHYNAGLETISDYLEAQTLRQQADGEYIIARTKLEIHKTEYLKATGRL
ncbi:outer membrane protein TolC [Parabacteroides sp. PFB2-10]|uniref:TolC family protein n=1 Tax=Parabacteroides sp. PFB2-10 TaxID=1742405 RepID=UPI00247440F6|nr:TolC family protein [Parabacteroides sp. PFB2-10]MDH6312038.1 outer membrane protein TolC [Parabacteroides sp. PFB2-10]MDL2244186.1 TolC family protein [Parabacteroides sp. OttesenSCG-928-J18]